VISISFSLFLQSIRQIGRQVYNTTIAEDSRHHGFKQNDSKFKILKLKIKNVLRTALFLIHMQNIGFETGFDRSRCNIQFNPFTVPSTVTEWSLCRCGAGAFACIV